MGKGEGDARKHDSIEIRDDLATRRMNEGKDQEDPPKHWQCAGVRKIAVRRTDIGHPVNMATANWRYMSFVVKASAEEDRLTLGPRPRQRLE